jgi:hypothetical protein
MKKLKILLIIFFASSLISAQNFSGTYNSYNPSNGIRVALTLNQNSNNVVSGKLILNNNDSYTIEGKVDDYDGETALTGSINKGNEISFFEAYLEGNQLWFTWVPADANAQPDYYSAIEVVLEKENSSASNNNMKDHQMNKEYTGGQNNNYQYDPMLIGVWRYTDSYTSGDFSMVTEKYMEVRPDGSYSYGNGKVAGGGDSGTFDSGSGGDVIQGKWRTENGLIYIDEGHGQFVPYSGYYIEGNTLMLKFNNGSKEIWNRVY